MKKLSLFFLLFFAQLMAFSQNEMYLKIMEGLVSKIDTSTTNSVALQDLANKFDRIAQKETTQWLPNYYAALCYVNMANQLFVTNEVAKIDPVVDKALPFLTKAKELEANNSDIFCLEKMFHTAKMMADPQNRYMEYGPKADAALAKAKELDAENPRVYLLTGIDKFFTPKEYGGSKKEAKKLFETGKEKLATFKPASTIHPSWGKTMIEYLLAQKEEEAGPRR